MIYFFVKRYGDAQFLSLPNHIAGKNIEFAFFPGPEINLHGCGGFSRDQFCPLNDGPDNLI